MEFIILLPAVVIIGILILSKMPKVEDIAKQNKRVISDFCNVGAAIFRARDNTEDNKIHFTFDICNTTTYEIEKIKITIERLS